MAPEKKLLEKFKTICDKAQATSSLKIFLLCVIDLIEELQSTAYGLAIIKSIIESAQPHLQIIAVKTYLASSEMERVRQAFKEYMEIKQIAAGYAFSIEFDAYSHPDPKKRIFSTWHPLTSKRQILAMECDKLARLAPEHYDFLCQFATIFCSVNGYYNTTLTELNLPYFMEWVNATNNYEEFKADKIWHHWDIVASIYQVRTEGKEIVTELQDINPLEASRTSQFLKNINETLIAPAESNLSLDISLEDLKYSFQKVCLFIAQQLERKHIPSVQKKEKSVTFSKQGSKIIIKYGQKQEFFDVSDGTGKYLNAFYKNPNEPIEEKRLWAKMHNNSAIESLDGGEKNSLIEHRKSVNKRLKKIGLSQAFEKTKSDKKIENQKISHWFNKKYPVTPHSN